ncbi:hypothetical protein [Microbispora sp. CA-102843]|uniref:hypothetical protein n=1 Tax=Microbispora sp. CA-102843 TaxID=3239952 RepID=UPI003D8B0AB3
MASIDAQPSAGDPTTADRRTIGPYVPVRRLGEGGMGIVYLARDPAGRQVAHRHYLVTEYVDGPDLSSVIDAQGCFLSTPRTRVCRTAWRRSASTRRGSGSSPTCPSRRSEGVVPLR